MLFAVRMEVSIPDTLDPELRATLVSEEREYCQALQRQGKWLHIWRIVGQYSNLSIFDVDDNDELHQILWGLPLFQHLTITVEPLAVHPSELTVT